MATLPATPAPPALHRVPDELADRDLVARARAGDDDAFALLYHRYRDRVCAYVNGIVRDHARAEDLCQDVFISALRRLRETEAPIAFRPWVFEIARNAAIDHWRRARRLEEVPYDACDDGGMSSADQRRMAQRVPSPEGAVDVKQRLGHLRGAFDELSEPQHQVLVMRELEGLTYAEIGERLGMSRPSVESTLFRARRRLEVEFEELVSGERCLRVQGLIARAHGGAVGVRDGRRISRHVPHCPPCRRAAVAAGIDERILVRRAPLRRRIAGLLPLPAFLKRTWLTDLGAHATTVDPTVASHWAGTVAKVAATVAVAGAGAGVATQPLRSQDDRPARPSPALVQPAGAGVPGSPPVGVAGVAGAAAVVAGTATAGAATPAPAQEGGIFDAVREVGMVAIPAGEEAAGDEGATTDPAVDGTGAAPGTDLGTALGGVGTLPDGVAGTDGLGGGILGAIGDGSGPVAPDPKSAGGPADAGGGGGAPADPGGAGAGAGSADAGAGGGGRGATDVDAGGGGGRGATDVDAGGGGGRGATDVDAGGGGGRGATDVDAGGGGGRGATDVGAGGGGRGATDVGAGGGGRGATDVDPGGGGRGATDADGDGAGRGARDVDAGAGGGGRGTTDVDAGGGRGATDVDAVGGGTTGGDAGAGGATVVGAGGASGDERGRGAGRGREGRDATDAGRPGRGRGRDEDGAPGSGAHGGVSDGLGAIVGGPGGVLMQPDERPAADERERGRGRGRRDQDAAPAEPGDGEARGRGRRRDVDGVAAELVAGIREAVEELLEDAGRERAGDEDAKPGSRRRARGRGRDRDRDDDTPRAAAGDDRPADVTPALGAVAPPVAGEAPPASPEPAPPAGAPAVPSTAPAAPDASPSPPASGDPAIEFDSSEPVAPALADAVAEATDSAVGVAAP